MLCAIGQRQHTNGRCSAAMGNEPYPHLPLYFGRRAVRNLILVSCLAAAAAIAFSNSEAWADHAYRSYGYYGPRQTGYAGFNWHNPGYFFPRHVYRPYAVYQPYPVYNSYSVHRSYGYAPYYDYSNNVYISGPNFNFGVSGY
jgi:hypothetical protein